MLSIAFEHPEAQPISGSFSFQIDDGWYYYFSNLELVDFHLEQDREALLLRLAKFVEAGVERRLLRKLFKVSRSTLQRAVNRFRESGEHAFRDFSRKPRGVSSIVGKTKEKAERLLAGGMSAYAVAKMLKVSKGTLYHNLRKGFLRPDLAERTTPADVAGGEDDGMVGRGTRDRLDREAPMGRGARDAKRRVQASKGELNEAEPRFDEACSAVPLGGTLLAIPLLVEEGLLKAEIHLSLSGGFFGITTILLHQAIRFLARVPTIEKLGKLPPGEIGRLLGMDRAPETKTIRRKLRELSSDLGQVKNLARDLASQWMLFGSDAYATLYVDGHVKVYTGRLGRLPKHFVSRMKLCLPASVSYWINAFGGMPLLCINKMLDEGLIRMLEDDMIPELELMGVLKPGAPDLIADRNARPVLTLVFDREGWSPDLFERLARRGIAVITWHKGFKANPNEKCRFRKLPVPIVGPVGESGISEFSLRHEEIKLSNGLRVRQVLRKLKCGRLVPFVTTDFHMPLPRVASSMFSRWCQENFFKYMKQEFNLGNMSVHELLDLDPEQRVVNPARRKLGKEIKKNTVKLGKLVKKAAKAKGADAESLKAEIDELNEQVAEDVDRHAQMPTHVKAGELGDDEKLQALGENEKLLLDMIRMICYRVETRLAMVLVKKWNDKRARGIVVRLFQSAADIIPEHDKGILRVRILGSARDSDDVVAAELLEELNRKKAVYPGTNLRMVYELPPNRKKRANPGSNTLH